MPLFDSLGLFHNFCCALFSVSEIDRGMEKRGERAGEELEIVNRQLSSFILVDGSIYLLPGLFVIVSAWPAVTAFALFTVVGWNRRIVKRLEAEKNCFRIREKKKTGGIVKRVRVNGDVEGLQCREIIFHLASSRHETKGRDKDNGDLVRVMSRR